VRKLVVPRVGALVLVLPALTIVADTIALFGGLLMGMFELGQTRAYYMNHVITALTLRDVASGVGKTLFFAFFIGVIACYKTFGDKPVLRGVDLDVGRGETVVVLGGSGSGKSVLLRHTIALHLPDRGAVWIDGHEVTASSEEELIETRKKVGMLFQAGALFDSMSVLDNVAFALREHTDWSEERIHARVVEVLGLVELEGVEDLMPADLSGGMRKRVALARAIAIAPQAILYDEPTTGLDPVTAATINALIRSLQSRLGVTSIVVTHDIHSAFTVGDRIAFLDEGRIAFDGTVEEARRTSDPLLRRFLEGSGYG
jgi:phospholipid/cholesterol/gamma-HCH transport system ATP-binding protein